MGRAQAGEAERVAAGAADVKRAAAPGRGRDAVGRADARIHRQTPAAAGPRAPNQAATQIRQSPKLHVSLSPLCEIGGSFAFAVLC